MTDNVRRLVLRHAEAHEIHRAAIEEGMRSMYDDGMLKVLGVDTSAGAADLEKQLQEGARQLKEFKEQVRRCFKLPSGLAAGQQLRMVIRIALAPSGALAGEPEMVAAKMSPLGPGMRSGGLLRRLRAKDLDNDLAQIARPLQGALAPGGHHGGRAAPRARSGVR